MDHEAFQPTVCVSELSYQWVKGVSRNWGTVEREEKREREREGEKRERAFIDEEMMISITRECKLFSWGGGAASHKEAKKPRV